MFTPLNEHFIMHTSYLVFHSALPKLEKLRFKFSVEQCGQTKHLSPEWDLIPTTVNVDKYKQWNTSFVNTTYPDMTRWTSHAISEQQCIGSCTTGQAGTTQRYIQYPHSLLLLLIQEKLTQKAFLILTQEIKRDIIYCHMNLPSSARQLTNLQQLMAHFNFTCCRLCSYFQHMGLKIKPNWLLLFFLCWKSIFPFCLSPHISWNWDRKFSSFDYPRPNCLTPMHILSISLPKDNAELT
jgi:hypothetical protein